jgi:hypothetical protein
MFGIKELKNRIDELENSNKRILEVISSLSVSSNSYSQEIERLNTKLYNIGEPGNLVNNLREEMESKLSKIQLAIDSSVTSVNSDLTQLIDNLESHTKESISLEVISMTSLLDSTADRLEQLIKSNCDLVDSKIPPVVSDIRDITKILDSFNGEIFKCLSKTDSILSSTDSKIASFEKKMDEKLLSFSNSIIEKYIQSTETILRWSKELLMVHVFSGKQELNLAELKRELVTPSLKEKWDEKEKRAVAEADDKLKTKGQLLVDKKKSLESQLLIAQKTNKKDEQASINGQLQLLNFILES